MSGILLIYSKNNNCGIHFNSIGKSWRECFCGRSELKDCPSLRNLIKCVASMAVPFAFRCRPLEFKHVSSIDILLINVAPCLDDKLWTFSFISSIFDIKPQSCLNVRPEIPILELGNFCLAVVICFFHVTNTFVYSGMKSRPPFWILTLDGFRCFAHARVSSSWLANKKILFC